MCRPMSNSPSPADPDMLMTLGDWRRKGEAPPFGPVLLNCTSNWWAEGREAEAGLPRVNLRLKILLFLIRFETPIYERYFTA